MIKKLCSNNRKGIINSMIKTKSMGELEIFQSFGLINLKDGDNIVSHKIMIAFIEFKIKGTMGSKLENLIF